MPAFLPYLVVPLFFAADYVATEETLKAGIEGYKQRAEACRKKAIPELEALISRQSKTLAAVKKGKIVPTLVGTGKDFQELKDGSWEFSTGDEKANRIWWLTKEIDDRRQLLVGIKAKKIYPQIWVPFKSTGGCGCFAGGIVPIKVSKDVVRAWAITDSFEKPTECIFETLEREGFVEGEGAAIRGVYQFVGSRGDNPVFRHVDTIPVGGSKCLFDERGEFHVFPQLYR